MDPFNLSDRVIVITGASSGIGQAIAIACGNRGAKLVLIGRDKGRLEETTTKLNPNCEFKLIIADLATPESVDTIVSAIKEMSVKVSGFVHAAGISTTLPLKMTVSKKMVDFFQLNVASGVEIVGKITSKQMADERGGSVVFISSVMGVNGEVGKTIYSLTKGAILAGVKSMALELASRKIRVNAISPGVVETPMVANSFYAQDPVNFERVKGLHPLGLGTVEDIANACVFLLSDGARWITGTNLIIDGGYTAK